MYEVAAPHTTSFRFSRFEAAEATEGQPGLLAADADAASTDGARMALLNKGARREIEAVVRDIEKIETAVEASFQDQFVKAMAIPHKSEPYEKLAAAVELPERILTPDEAPAIESGRRINDD